MNSLNSHLPYTLGLDVGIASVGWCLLGETRIIDLGVRCFDRAENEKGEPHNLKRRLLRSQRRRIRRRAFRLLKIRRLFRDYGLIPDQDPNHLAQASEASPWDLRAAGLDRLLTAEEWARTIYHIVKHRGFLSTRKAELTDEKKDSGKLSKGVSRTRGLMLQGKWRTPGELAARAPEFADAKRNKSGDYKNTFDRSLLRSEICQLFSRQREAGSEYASTDFEEQILSLFSHQRPALTGSAMLNLIGKCSFEKEEFRAPKNSWTAERFVWLTRLNNLRISDNGIGRPLTIEEREAVIDLPYDEKKTKVTYKSLRAHLKKSTGFPDVAKFAGLSYRSDEKDPEAATLIDLKGWHSVRSALANAGLDHEWEILSGDPKRLDELAVTLAVYKTDDEIRAELQNAGFNAEVIEALLSISFHDFVQLSLKALRKIVPNMEHGERFDQACTLAGYCHYSPNADTGKQKFLPPIPSGEIRNPVVLRALNQTRKVINTIVRKYGPPRAVHIELGRDLSKSWEEREKIKKEQAKWQEDKQSAKDLFVDTFKLEPSTKNQDLLKFRLYAEQQGKCAYSLGKLELERLIEPGYAEIDHVLPYSRSFDDSQNNKVLVLTAENRNKENKTPFEYLDGASNSERWLRFATWAEANHNYRRAKRDRLLRRHFDEKEAQEFSERNLNDTRYLARFMKNFIERNLLLSGADQMEKVICVNGQFTSFLRVRWGLIKNREQSDRHHALDAAVIAAADKKLIKRVSDFSRHGRLIQRPDGLFVSRQTGAVLELEQAVEMGNRFPQPWDNFRNELMARLDPAPLVKLLEGDHSNYTEDDLATVLSLFVSRAPKRRNSGPAHQETIRSAKRLLQGKSSTRMPLSKLTLKWLDRIVGAEDPRNRPLIDGLRDRLLAHNDNAKRAFAEPFYKPDKTGKPTVLVRSVKLLETQKGGLPVRRGIADQASMIRADVFKKLGKFFIVPVYQADRVKKELPNRAVVAYKERQQWDVIDDTYQFQFSLYANDVVGLKSKDKAYFGYYEGLDVSTGAINIVVHDHDKTTGKNGCYHGIGVKTASSFEKFHVDPLGRIFKVKQEVRHALA